MSQDVARIARGAGLLLPATLAGNALLLGLDLYLNGALGNADYGLFGAGRRLFAFAGFVALLGMENAVIRFVATDPAGGDGAVKRALALVLWASGVVGVALAAAALLWGDAWVGGRGVLLAGAASIPLAAVRLVFIAAAQGRGSVTPRAVVMFLLWPVVQFAGFLLLIPTGGVVGAAWAYTAAVAVGAVVAHVWYARLRPSWRHEPGGPSPRELLAWSWPLWVQGMVMAAYTWADQVFLAGLRSPEEAGWYGPVATLAPLFGLGLGALNGVFATVIAERHAAGDSAGLARLYRVVTRWAVILAAPPILVCLASPGLVLSVWPEGSAEAIPALRITALVYVGCTLVGSVNYLLLMAGHQRATLWNGIPAVLVNLALSVALIPRFGVTGAALANGGSMLAANGIGLVQVWRLLGLHPFHRGLLRPLAAALPATLAALFVARLSGPPFAVALLTGVASGVTYLGALVALGLDADDRDVIARVVARVRR